MIDVNISEMERISEELKKLYYETGQAESEAEEIGRRLLDSLDTASAQGLCPTIKNIVKTELTEETLKIHKYADTLDMIRQKYLFCEKQNYRLAEEETSWKAFQAKDKIVDLTVFNTFWDEIL